MEHYLYHLTFMVLEDAMYPVGGTPQSHVLENPATTGLKRYDAIAVQMLGK